MAIHDPVIATYIETYGKHWLSVRRFLRELPKVTGDRGYGDHRKEQEANALCLRTFADATYFKQFDAALDALEDLGQPRYGGQAVAAIIAQDSLTQSERELLYAPYEGVIPWASIQPPPFDWDYDDGSAGLREPYRSLVKAANQARRVSHLQAIVEGRA